MKILTTLLQSALYTDTYAHLSELLLGKLKKAMGLFSHASFLVTCTSRGGNGLRSRLLTTV